MAEVRKVSLGHTVVRWIERVLAALLLVAALAVVIPNCIVPDRSSGIGTRPGAGHLALGPVIVYAVVGLAFVACIVAGQSRSRALRLTGWTLLITYTLLITKLLQLLTG